MNRFIGPEKEKEISVFDKIVKDSKHSLSKDQKKESKKKHDLPLPFTAFAPENLTDEEKKIRRDIIIKIRNYAALFTDEEPVGVAGRGNETGGFRKAQPWEGIYQREAGGRWGCGDVQRRIRLTQGEGIGQDHAEACEGQDRDEGGTAHGTGN